MIARRRRQGTILGPIRVLYDLGTIRDLTDGQLLERFATERNEAAELAFAALVERHEAMVWRVCRSILRDEHAAEDAFQATFLVLFRKARSLWVRDSLGPWLHRVACRAAERARDRMIRRRHLIRRLLEVAAASACARADSGAAADLHEEIDRLADRHRVPLVMCDLEDYTYEEAAQQLGWTVGTVKSRLARARERLRERLVRRGLGQADARLGVLALPVPTSSVLPAELSRSAMTIASRFARDRTVPMAILKLSDGALKTMRWNPLTIAAGAAFVAALSVGMGVMAHITFGTRAGSEGGIPVVPPAQAAEGNPHAESKSLIAPLLAESQVEIKRMEPGFQKARLLSELATLQAELGYSDAARETGHRAMAVAQAIEEEQTRVSELREAAKAQGAAGDLEGALATEELIGDGSADARTYREFVLQEVGEALAKAGHLDQAARVLSLMRRKGLKSGVLAFMLTSAYAKSGDTRAASQTADSIADEVMRVGAMVGMAWDGSTFCGEMEDGIALARFHAGDRIAAKEYLEKARTIASSIPDGEGRGRALGTIARAMIGMGDLPGAIRLVETIADHVGRDRALVDIATIQAKSGRWDDAIKSAGDIRSDALRMVALTRVAKARGLAKDPSAAQELFAQALELTKSLTLDSRPDLTGPYHVALAQAETGDYRSARETLLRSRPDDMSEAAFLIALVKARSGDALGAMQTMEGLSSSSTSERSLISREVARKQAESGVPSRIVRDWIEEITSPILRVRARMGLAQGLAAVERRPAQGGTMRSR